MKGILFMVLLPLLSQPAQEGLDFPEPGLTACPAAWATRLEGARPSGSSGSGASSLSSLTHDLHVSYGNLGVEGSLAILQLRIFKDDLEQALGRLSGEEDLLMEVSPEMDGLFLEYLRENFVLEVGGKALSPILLGSGYDELDREPVWTYQVRYDAETPIRTARITNTILFEIFPDQRNVVRVVRFPEERRSAHYFAPGEETREVTFGGGGGKNRPPGTSQAPGGRVRPGPGGGTRPKSRSPGRATGETTARRELRATRLSGSCPDHAPESPPGCFPTP